MDKSLVTLGNTRSVWFPPQFDGTVDNRSLAATPIEYYDLNGNILSNFHSSGFFYRHDQRTFLISARHALTGLDCFTDQPYSKTGFLPKKVRVYGAFSNGSSSSRRSFDLLIRTEDEVPNWLQDPEFNDLNTDIALVEVREENHLQIHCVNDGEDIPLIANVGFECFVVGYPNKNYFQPHLPIWRRGALGYEPTMPVHDRPMFLVDATTSEGLSGAAIYQRWHGPAPLRESDGSISIKLESIVTTTLIGVYGGRLANANQLGEVGYGWYANRIPMIISQTPVYRPGKPKELKLSSLTGSFTIESVPKS